MSVRLLFSVFVIAIITSCSQLETSRPESVRPVKEFNPRNELGLNLPNLLDQVDEAIKLGGRAPEYLASDLFIKGNDASIRGDYQTASQLFKYVHKLVPTDHFVEKKYAVELIRLGELKEAQSILENLFRANPKDESTGLILAGVYSALEKPEYAKEIYKKVIATFNSEEACLYLAKSYALEKNYKAAHKLLAGCEKKMKEEPAFAFYRGKIEYERGSTKAAKKFFEKSLKIDKTFAQATLAIGAIYEDREEFENAISEYKRFLNVEGNSNNPTVLNKMVNLMLTMDGHPEVGPYLETLVALEPNDLNIKVRLGLMYSESGRYIEAVKVLKDVLEVVPESDKILYYLGALSQQLNHANDSVGYYSKISNSSPLYGDASIQLGQIYSTLAREDYVQGKKDNIARFQTFVSTRIKDHEELALELKMIEAGFYDDTLQFPKAIETLSVYKTNKNFTDSHSYYLASLFEKNGQFLEARSMVQKILDKDPNNPHALNFLGYSFLERNENLEVAFEYISKAVKLKPDDGYIRDSLAWYLYSTGKYQEALKEEKKAFELVKTDAIISKHLAKIYQSLNNFDKAKEFYSEALKNSKAQAEREDVLKSLEEMEKTRLPASLSK